MKQTKSKGITYQYWYVEHHIGDKIKWCYLGKYEQLPEEFKKLLHKDTQTDTQIAKDSEIPKSSFFNKNNREMTCRGSLAWFGRQTHNLENTNGANAQLSRGRGLESRPRHQELSR